MRTMRDTVTTPSALAVASPPAAAREEGTGGPRTRWLLAALLALDSLLLHWVGLGLGAQLVCVVVLGLWIGAGRAVVALLPQGELELDPATRLVLEALTGQVLHTGLAFALFHTAVMSWLGLPDVRAAAVVALCALVPLACLGFARARRGERRGVPSATAATLALASLIAATTAFGFRNNELAEDGDLRHWLAAGTQATFRVPNWGAPYDRNLHFFAGGLARRGFPAGFANGHTNHSGVATILTAVAFPTSGPSPSRVVAFSKPLCLLWIFAGLQAAGALARSLGAPPRVAWMAALGVALFSGLNPFAIPAQESTQRILAVAGTLYHNVTQQSSVALGLTGLLLACAELRRPGRAFALGCALISASFFFKPSLFCVVMPPLTLVALWRCEAGHRRFVLAGLGLAVGVSVLWYVYPLVLRVPRQPVPPLAVAWLGLQSIRVPGHVPWPTSSPLSLLATVVLLGYASLVLPLASAAARFVPRLRRGPLAALRSARPVVLVLVGAFLLGQVTGLFLFEQGPKKMHGRVLFGLAAGVLCLLPLVVHEIARLPRPGLRRVAWSLYLAQIASGVWNLWIYTFYGSL